MADYYSHKGPPPVAVTCAGSTQSDAAALTLGALNNVSGSDATKGCILPTAAAGDVVQVYSNAATNALKVYAQSGGKINDGSANAAMSVTARKLTLFINLNGTDWAACLGS